MAPHLLDIGEVARASGLAPSALRFYERRGLIGSAGRSGLRRRFEPEVLERLAIIVAAQESEFTLREIEELLNTDDTGSGLRTRLGAKAEAIDEEIDRLATIRDRLRHAATCRAPRLMECETFRGCLTDALPRRASPAVAEPRES